MLQFLSLISDGLGDVKSNSWHETLFFVQFNFFKSANQINAKIWTAQKHASFAECTKDPGYVIVFSLINCLQNLHMSYEGYSSEHGPTKGQLISKCLLGVIVSTKKTTKIFQDFCPSPQCPFFGNFCPKIIFHVKTSRCRLIYHH